MPENRRFPHEPSSETHGCEVDCEEPEHEALGRTATTILVERARSGEQAAYAEVVERFHGYLRATFHGRIPDSLRGELDTIAAVRNVEADIAIGLDRFEQRGKGAFRAYVYRVARNRLIDLWRRQSTSEGAAGVALPLDMGSECEGEVAVESPAGGVEDPVLRAELQAAILGELTKDGKFEESDVMAFWLHYVEEVSWQEIGALMRTNPDTISRRVRRRVNQVKVRLERLLRE